jgi:hypothetical protein
MSEQYGTPEQKVVAHDERALAEERAHTAEVDAVRTSVVVDLLRAAVGGVRELHVENGYAPKLRAIFRS